MPALAWQADAAHHALDERRRRTCRRCGDKIERGEPEFPIEGVGRMHLPCAQVPRRTHSALTSSLDETLRTCTQRCPRCHTCAGQAHCADAGLPLVAPVCKHWRRTGTCVFQDRCFFQHPQAARAAVQPSRQAAKPSGADAATRAARAAAWRAWHISNANQTPTPAAPTPPAEASEGPPCGSTLGAASAGLAGQDTTAWGGALPTTPGAALTTHSGPVSSGGAYGLRQGIEWSATRAPRKRVRNAFRSGVFRRCGAFGFPLSRAFVMCTVPQACNQQASGPAGHGDVPWIIELVPRACSPCWCRHLGVTGLSPPLLPYLAGHEARPPLGRWLLDMVGREVLRLSSPILPDAAGHKACAPLGRWQLDVFGRAAMRAGAGVLDAAGGKSALALNLKPKT